MGHERILHDPRYAWSLRGPAGADPCILALDRNKNDTTKMKMWSKLRDIVKEELLVFCSLLGAVTSMRLAPMSMSSIPPEYASAAARRQAESTEFITNKMCPFAQKAWIALEQSGIPYVSREVDLYGPGGKPEWFLDYNPEGTVPVLVCYGGAMIVCESEDILDCLCDGTIEGPEENKLLLDDNVDDRKKGLVKKWRRAVSTKLLPVGKKAVLQRSAESKDALFGLLREMNSEVQGPFLCGDEVTVADCAAFPFLWRINDEFGPISGECGAISDWLSKCKEIPAFKKSLQSSWWWWW